MAKKIVYLLVLLALPENLTSQNQKIDSLKNLLFSLKSADLEYVDVLFELSRQYADVDNETSLMYVNLAVVKARESKDSLKIVKTTRLKAQVLRRLGSIDSAFLLFDHALAVSRRNGYRDEVKMLLNSLGVAHLLNGKFDEALKVLFEALELQEKDENQMGITVALHNIGVTYYRLENYDKALMFYERELRIKDEAEIKHLYANTLCDISLCYAYKNDFLRATDYITRGFLSCDSSCSDDFLIDAYFSLGLIAYSQGKVNESETQFLKVICTIQEKWRSAAAARQLKLFDTDLHNA